MQRSVDVLRYREAGDISRLLLEAGNDAALAQLKAAAAPAAVIVRASDVDTFSGREGCLDCGMQKRTGKNRTTIDLWRMLGRKPKQLPLVRSAYTSAGRLGAALDALFRNARKHGERNLYLIGVDEVIFEHLQSKTADEPSRGADIRWPLFLRSVKVDPELEKSFLGLSFQYADVRKRIMVARSCDLTTLITGATGTGKEIVARAIHEGSRRNSGTGVFVPVNCGAIPMHLLESELFGCEPNVVTDVKKRVVGLWNYADKGTLFLDEIGHMTLDHQARILRAIESGKIRRIGATEELSVDVRVIAATNRDLEMLVERGEFLEDLYFRLAQLIIYTPSLHESPPEDLRHIAQQLWLKNGRETPLPDEILDLLPEYTRVGNVRQLNNVLIRLAAYMDADGIRKINRDFFESVMRLPGPVKPSPPRPSPQALTDYVADCLTHLRETMVVIRTCKVQLRSLARPEAIGQDTAAGLRLNLEEPCRQLERLCLDPSRFHRHLVFLETCRFKDMLATLLDQAASQPMYARSFWQSELKPQYDRLLSAMADEIRQIEHRDSRC